MTPTKEHQEGTIKEVHVRIIGTLGKRTRTRTAKELERAPVII